MPRNEFCANCRFWFGTSAHQGWCHRYPPRLARSLDQHAWAPVDWNYPKTPEHDWCGEWEAQRD